LTLSIAAPLLARFKAGGARGGNVILCKKPLLLLCKIEPFLGEVNAAQTARLTELAAILFS